MQNSNKLNNDKQKNGIMVFFGGLTENFDEKKERNL